LEFSELSEIEERLQGSLTSRQQWILGTRRQPEFSAPIAVAGEDEPGTVDVADPSPSQETQIVDNEQQVRLGKCLSSLPAKERLLLQLRFEQELSLDEIARLCGLQDAQRAHRMLATVLNKLRHALT
jgi:RNA polymerase sigma factor (sigma-70 family)